MKKAIESGYREVLNDKTTAGRRQTPLVMASALGRWGYVPSIESWYHSYFRVAAVKVLVDGQGDRADAISAADALGRSAAW